MPPQSRTSKTIALSLGLAIGSFSSLLSTMVLVRLFSQEDFATYRQTLLVFSMVAPFLGMGMAKSVMYFLPTADKNRRGAIILEAVGPLVFAGALYFFVMIFGGNRIAALLWNNPKLEYTLLITAPIAFLSLTSSVLPTSLIATEKVSLAALLGVIRGISIALITTIVAISFIQLEYALLAHVLAYCGIFSLSFVIFRKHFSFTKPGFSGVKKHFAFGLPLCLSAATTILSRNVDRVMVSSLCGPNQFAIFDRGAFELPLVAVVTGSMTTVLLVDYKKLFAQGRTEEILRLLHRSVEKSALFLMPAMCFMFAFAPELITCMFGETYRESYIVFRIYLLLLPNRTIVFASIALAAGKTKELAWASAIALLANVFLTYFAISLLGYVGGAVSTVIAVYFVSGFLRATIAKNTLGISMSEFLPVSSLLHLIALSIIPLLPVLACMFFFDITNDFARLSLAFVGYLAGLFLVYWNRGYVSPSMLRKRLFSK